ncbi:MAG: ATP-dependent helicase, partial [Betaproteobacteria bacterium]
MLYSHAVIATPIFDRLNAAQRAAARFGGRDEQGAFAAGPLLIVAGAGTGKTNTLAHRVAHLVLEGVSPQRILLLTFTRRAAEEMTRRAQRIVAAVLDEKAAGDARNRMPVPAAAVKLPWSGTFHSLANRLIRRHAARVGLDPSFSVLDRGDAADLMDVVRHELGFSKSKQRFPRKDVCLAIYSHRVNAQRPLADTLAGAFPWCAQWEKELTQLYRTYIDRKLANQALDYDDLLLYWHAMAQDPALAAEMSSLFDQILVDEYQDTNALQAEILYALRPSGAGVTVVGDDAQSIYSFRAATVENILNFPSSFAPAANLI